MKRYNINLWITLVFITLKNLPLTDSFQCFECENCPTIDEDNRDYIKECTNLESFSTQGMDLVADTTKSQNAHNSTASSSLAASTPTLSSSTSVSKPESELSTTKSSVVEIMSTTEKQKVTSSWSIFPNSLEESDLTNFKPESEDRSDEIFSWRSRQASSICYVLKLNYDGHEITKRGCGLRGQKKEETCQILGNAEPNSECEICEGNLCNSGSRFRAGIVGLLAILYVLVTYV